MSQEVAADKALMQLMDARGTLMELKVHMDCIGNAWKLCCAHRTVPLTYVVPDGSFSSWTAMLSMSMPLPATFTTTTFCYLGTLILLKFHLLVKKNFHLLVKTKRCYYEQCRTQDCLSCCTLMFLATCLFDIPRIIEQGFAIGSF